MFVDTNTFGYNENLGLSTEESERIFTNIILLLGAEKWLDISFKNCVVDI